MVRTRTRTRTQTRRDSGFVEELPEAFLIIRFVCSSKNQFWQASIFLLIQVWHLLAFIEPVKGLFLEETKGLFVF